MKIEQPNIEQTDRGGTVSRHPAFAQIGASRVSGYTRLYDSEFVHQHYMTVTIRRSELHRELSRDWHFGRDELIEVAMSEAQWATFVSSPNVGSGVPCTIQHLKGEGRVAGIPESDVSASFKREVDTDMKEAVEFLEALSADIAKSGLSGKKIDALESKVRMARMRITSSLEFVADQFSKHMEKTTEKAKQEVHGYMTATLQRAGLEALTDGSLPLKLGHDE